MLVPFPEMGHRGKSRVGGECGKQGRVLDLALFLSVPFFFFFFGKGFFLCVTWTKLFKVKRFFI